MISKNVNRVETDDEHWDLIIKPHSKWIDFKTKELWKYRDLLFLFVKRDFVSVYKQTVLGPLWFFIQPVFSTLIFILIFNFFGKISTDGAPPVLFYLGGLTLWNYFADCLTKTSDTFILNQNIFGKVYFPRLIVPLSVILSNLLKLVIQFALFLIAFGYYLIIDPGKIEPNYIILLFPIMVIIIAGLSLGFGIIFSALTTKYRDMKFLLQFGVQLLMYASSIVIPLSQVPEKFRWIMKLNPLVSVIEGFKYGFLGTGVFQPLDLIYSFFCMVLFLFLGSIIFNRVEKSFMDTV
jgi:lipopolysaccharide transport system permease protein